MATKQQRHRGAKQKHRKSISGSPNMGREQKIPLQQRINPVYLEEESYIQKLIEHRQDKLNEKTQTDLEVLFFTEGLPPESAAKHDETDGSGSSLKSLQSAELQETPTNNFLESIVQIEEEKLFDRVKEEISYDESVLFQPSSEKPSIPNVESSTVASPSSQGLYEAPLPNISLRNKHRLYNRLLEENKYHLFNQSGELIGLQENSQRGGQLMRYECNRNFPVHFVLIDEDQLNGEHQMEESNVLVLNISQLQFYHHYLFSEEVFLAKSIERAFKEYSVSKRKATAEMLLQRISILRNSITDSKENSDKLKDRLKEILELRKKFHLEKKLQKERVQELLEEYKTLKALRKTQQFNATTLKLIISLDESKAEEKNSFMEEFFEEEAKETFDLQTLEYQEKKRDRKMSRKSLTPEELDNLPAMPSKPNMEKIKSSLRKRFKESHFDAEQSSIEIHKSSIPRVCPTSNAVEQKRISSVSALKYQLKVFCNNELIGGLNENVMTEDFEIHFNSSISIRLISRLPEQIRIELVEERPMKPRIKLAKIFVPVPRLHEGNIDASDYSQLEFSSQKSIQSDLGISAGQFCIRKNQQQLVNGFLSMKIGWNDSERSSSIPKKTLPRSSLTNVNQSNSQFDPMNPDVEPRVAIKGTTNEDSNEEEEKDDEERFTFLEEELTFCSLEEFRNNKRNKILSERARKSLKYKDIKLVPCNERQLVDSEVTEKIIDETLGMDPIDLQRFKGKKYLTGTYLTISRYCKSLNEECEENQLLMENMPTLASIATAFFKLFGPNRPLKPTRRRQGSHRLSSRNVDVTQFKISLNIVRAFGIPQRQEEVQMNVRKSSNMSSPNTNGYRPLNIRPFVTATFKDTSVRTSTGDGPNPTWNEQMSVPLNFKSWEDMKGYLIIQLFDEYVDDIVEDDRNRLTDIYQRISSRFIAELRIPLTDLFFSQRIEGTFEMNSPPLLGYSKTMMKTLQGQTGGGSAAFTGNNLIPDLKGPVFISLLINLEPFFEHDPFTTRHLECTEPEQLKTTVGMWMYDFICEFPYRRMDPFVTLLNGKRVFIVSLLGPINIPYQETEDKDHLEGQLRRYVALIPTLHTIDPCVELSGMWLLNHQVFNTLRCSTKDLAVILTNFYLSIGLSAWLMIGESQLRVNSCFVLLKESDTEYFIIDPVTGRKYQYTDTYCPMTSVFFLINDKNLWGNIQDEKKVFMTRYDVSDSSEWRSLFKRTPDIPRESLQERNYQFQMSYDIRNIHAIIESKLTKKISQWRGHRKTIWNRLVRDNLRRILVELEKDASTGENGDHLEKLNFLHNNFKISGCPLNMSYINLSDIVERVKAIGIHLNTDPRVEFGLSIYVHPYPNFIISVWVFLIALVPK